MKPVRATVRVDPALATQMAWDTTLYVARHLLGDLRSERVGEPCKYRFTAQLDM